MQARQWSNQTIREVMRPDWLVNGGRIWRKLNMMVTPRVVREVRRHFACDDLEGAELEDQGEEGTALTHWEKRIFEVALVCRNFLKCSQDFIFFFLRMKECLARIHRIQSILE